MKKLIGAILSLATSIAFGATTVPVQLLNPAGSSSGQAIVSTGASTAPAWGNVPVANVTGAAALTGATFTGPLLQSYASPTFIVNDTSGSGFAAMALESSGTLVWQLVKQASQNFVLQRWVAGSNVDNPISVSNSTGAVTMVDGITNTPVSATTLSASGLATLSGGIAGNTTGTAASAGTIGEVPSAAFSSVSMTTTTVQNLTSMNLTAGVYLVWGSATYTVGTGATLNIWLAGVSPTTGSLPALGTYFQSSGSITATGAATANAPMYLLTLSSSKTIYLTGEAVFSGGTVTATGFLAALRIH